MSKAFRLLHYFLSIILLASILHIAGITLVFAIDPILEIKQTPYPLTIDKKNDITIIVRTKDGSDFFLAPNYSFAAWSGNTLNRDASCTKGYNISAAHTGDLRKTNSKIIASWTDSAGCMNIGETWHFRLWAGQGWDAMNENNTIIGDDGKGGKDYDFAILPAGATTFATISAKNLKVFTGQRPIVILSNAAPGQKYTFWWEGDTTLIARYYPEPNDKPGDPEVMIPNPSFDDLLKKKQPAKLCMEYGNFRFPPGSNNSCNINGKFATFEIIGKQMPPPAPSGPIKCTILPSTSAPLNSKVDIKIENIAENTNVAAYAIDDKGNQSATSHTKADNTFSAVLNLIPKANLGSYVAVAYDEANPSKNMCVPNPTFTVGNFVVAPPVVVKQCGDGKGNTVMCAKGGGDSCVTEASRGPAIRTAIGCIHTNPTELAKDLLKFGVGIGGGLSFLMMILGAFQMLTSAGNPETLNAGKSRLTSAVIGLLLIIFSVLLLQIIGVDILQLPGFGK